MTESQKDKLPKVIAFIVATFVITLIVYRVNQHNAAVDKLNELAKQHKQPDSSLQAILIADSLYMYGKHR